MLHKRMACYMRVRMSMQSGESDGVPKYSYDCFSLLRRTLPGGVKSWCVKHMHLVMIDVACFVEGRSVSLCSYANGRYLIEAASAESRSGASQSMLHYYYCYRSSSGTPPLEVPSDVQPKMCKPSGTSGHASS